MGVPYKSLGPLTGPNEEMAHEALMEGWSRNKRTHSVTESPALDPKTSRAQEDSVLTSISMEVDSTLAEGLEKTQ